VLQVSEDPEYEGSPRLGLHGGGEVNRSDVRWAVGIVTGASLGKATASAGGSLLRRSQLAGEEPLESPEYPVHELVDLRWVLIGRGILPEALDHLPLTGGESEGLESVGSVHLKDDCWAVQSSKRASSPVASTGTAGRSDASSSSSMHSSRKWYEPSRSRR
jgi:hypothetical protein